MYCFRVAIKGSQPKNFETYLHEKVATKKTDKLKYHKLIQRYYHLFGKENTLVLPMEVLKENPKKFLKKITDFCEIPYIEIKKIKKVNVSTNKNIIIQFWRPINWLFNQSIRILLLIAPAHVIRKIRHTYSHIKRALTKILNRVCKNCKQITIKNQVLKKKIEDIYRESNKKTNELIEIDLKKYNYPC